MNQFDNMVSNPLPRHYSGASSAEDVGKALAEGNRLYTQFSKADALENAFGKAERRAASTYSGGNIENAQRQEVRKLFEKRQKGWTADELAQINRVIYGDAIQNTARGVGKALDPTGLKALIHGGLAVKTGGLSLLSAAAGYGAKHLSEKMSANAIEELSRIIRAGGRRVSRVAPESAAERATRKLTPRLAAPAGYGASGLLGDENQ
jgi:hypothetical protein